MRGVLKITLADGTTKSSSAVNRELQDTVSSLPISSTHAPIRILAVEPESDIRDLYRRYLSYQGITLTTANNGGECLRSLNGNGKHKASSYDMILLDWHLDDESPESIIKQIRDKIPDQQIIVTATNLNGHAKGLRSIGIEVLEKPFRFSKLLSMIRPKIN